MRKFERIAVSLISLVTLPLCAAVAGILRHLHDARPMFTGTRQVRFLAEATSAGVLPYNGYQ